MRIFLTILLTLIDLAYLGQSLNQKEQNRAHYVMATCFITALLFLFYHLGGD